MPAFTPLNPRIFKSYDVRGRVGVDFDVPDAYRLGLAWGSFLRDTLPDRLADPVCVARDGRTHGLALQQAFQEGLVFCGHKVLDLGLVPTPILYWASDHLGAKGATMVTGSHNPPQDNGFKFTRAGAPFFGEALGALAMYPCVEEKQEGGGREEVEGFLDHYWTQVLSKVALPPTGLRVAWDFGHGAMAVLGEGILEHLPLMESLLLHEKVDGTFPLRKPDPTKEGALETLKEKILKDGLDGGFAFDGDGDRMVFVDREGLVWQGDEVLTYLAQGRPPTRMVWDVKSSRVLGRYLQEKAQHEVLVSPTGHVHVKALLRKEGACLGGEMSGHFFFKEHGYWDDGLFAALKVLEAMAFEDPCMARQHWPQRFSTPELRIPLPQGVEAEEIIALLRQSMAHEGGSFCERDGLCREDEKGWWLVRPSNTEACLVIRLESVEFTHLRRISERISSIMSKKGLIFFH